MTMTTPRLTPPTTVPCPDWCGDRPGHGYEWETDEGHDGRHHFREFGTHETFAAVTAEAVFQSGDELLSAGPWIEVVVHGNPIENSIGHHYDRMTAAEARIPRGRAARGR